MQVRFGQARTAYWYADKKTPKSPLDPHVEIMYDDKVIPTATVEAAIQDVTGAFKKFPAGATLVLEKNSTSHYSLFGMFGAEKLKQFLKFSPAQQNIPDDKAAIKNVMYQLGRRMNRMA